MYKKLLIASIVMSAGCTATPPDTSPTPPKPPTPFNDDFFNDEFLVSPDALMAENEFLSGDANYIPNGSQGFQDPAVNYQNANDAGGLAYHSNQFVPPQNPSSSFEVHEGVGDELLNQGLQNNGADPSMRFDPSFHTSSFPPSNEGGELVITANQSFKKTLKEYLTPQGYKLVWNTEFDVYFENDVTYSQPTLIKTLEAVAKDLNAMAVDIHMNVYTKNKVILVYSVRK